MKFIVTTLVALLIAVPAFAQGGAQIDSELEALRNSMAVIADTVGELSGRVEALEAAPPVVIEPPVVEPPPVEPPVVVVPPVDPPPNFDVTLSPPAQNSPLIVNVPVRGPGGFKFSYPGNRDVILMMPPTPRLEPMWVEGGKSIRVIGGEIKLCGWSDRHWMGRAFMTSAPVTFVEGMRVDLCDKELDAFVSRRGAKAVTLQSVYVTGIEGHPDRNHGDFFQAQMQGDFLPLLRVENAVVWTNYNVFVINNGVSNVELRRVEIHRKSLERARNGNFATDPRATIRLEDAWIDATMETPGGLTLARDMSLSEIESTNAVKSTVFPQIGAGSVKTGTTIQMPNATGVWNIGVPPGGSRSPGTTGFVDPNQIGLRYTSPWSINN